MSSRVTWRTTRSSGTPASQEGEVPEPERCDRSEGETLTQVAGSVEAAVLNAGAKSARASCPLSVSHAYWRAGVLAPNGQSSSRKGSGDPFAEVVTRGRSFVQDSRLQVGMMCALDPIKDRLVVSCLSFLKTIGHENDVCV